jgi:hypothetical protein
MDQNQNPVYKVGLLSRVNKQIRDLSEQGKLKGVNEALIAALKKVRDFCKEKPIEWGDPVRRTTREGGMVCRGICKPIVVEYAVFESDRTVIVLDIFPFPNCGFD